ncbi:hypothetical protein V496_07130 [Pseudogymnoascus sp. VKM F-4515 (FW-2607)]|nr:hypothetical protein V496_07130 [Pseudogymnoascus sp. VKM F-4515 (FW-2607)]KFY88557.1 hypothetical protein V498_06750 [Pseudogymnoascus sp. VKM F-4517 (FW-2822)]
MPKYEKDYRTVSKACEEFIRFHDPQGVHVKEMIRSALQKRNGGFSLDELTQKEGAAQKERETQKGGRE